MRHSSTILLTGLFALALPLGSLLAEEPAQKPGDGLRQVEPQAQKPGDGLRQVEPQAQKPDVPDAQQGRPKRDALRPNFDGNVPQDGFGMPPPPRGDSSYDFMRKVIELNLSDEEQIKLKRLAFEKPDEFRDELKKQFQAFRQKRNEERRKTEELQKIYREAANSEERQKALESIKVMVKDQFAKKMELNKRRLEETERSLQDSQKRLEDFKKKYEERKANADAIIDERVKEIIRDPNLEW